MNGILQDIGRGTHKYIAARYTFRRLFLTGLTALLTNIVGFAVLVIIDIPVIRDLALTTSIGVAVLIFTKLLLIPVALSYLGVSKKAARIAIAKDQAGDRKPRFSRASVERPGSLHRTADGHGGDCRIAGGDADWQRGDDAPQGR